MTNSPAPQRTTIPTGSLPDQLRPISVERPYFGAAAGRVLIRAGRTTVLCTASVEESVRRYVAAVKDKSFPDPQLHGY